MFPLIASYIDYLKTKGQKGRDPSLATLKAVRADLQGFITWWEERHRLTFDPANVIDRDLRDWQEQRQVKDGAKVSTINRANTNIRLFFAWAKTTGLINHNPAAELRDLPAELRAPPSVQPAAVSWLWRVASDQEDPTLRARDLALLTLLSDCGLRSQEAADLEIRDLDLRGQMLTVRAGKGRKARRLPLEGETLRRLREYMRVRCPNGVPGIGTDAERELLLLGRHYVPLDGSEEIDEESVEAADEAVERGPKWRKVWTPGMKTNTMRKRLDDLAAVAVARVTTQIEREPNLARVGELERVLRDLQIISPHKLRHGLAYRLRNSGYDPGYLQQLLGHSRVATSLLYGKPTDDDLREALGNANK